MLRRLVNGLTDVIYPKRCHSCKGALKGPSIDDLICPKCWSGIKRNVPPFCYSCGRHLDKGSFCKNICPGCLKTRLHFDRAFSPCVYEGPLKELIHEFKYKGKDYLGQPLSRLMTEFIREYDFPIWHLDFIVPVPLHGARLRERDFNQAEVLSRCVAGEFKKDVAIDILSKNRHTKTQTDLEINERLINVKGSFSVKNPAEIKGKNLCLVDDVFTTGATSSEAAFALKDAGANIVFVLTLAN